VSADTLDVGLRTATAPSTRPVLPRAQQPSRGAKRPIRTRRLKRALALLVLTIILQKSHTTLLSQVIYDQRQQHLSASLGTPSPNIGSGDALGLLQIESLRVNDVVVEGVSIEHLRGGPAHVAGSALPGDAGISVVYGHRTAYGGPFEGVGDLLNGDSVVMQARNGGPITRYVVDRVERRVQPDDLDLPNADRIAYLLLVTSEPGLFADEMIVVVARALPVTAAASVIPEFGDPVGRDAPFLDLLLVSSAVGGTLLAFGWIRRRVSPTLAIIVVAPIGTYAVLRLLLLADHAFALAR